MKKTMLFIVFILFLSIGALAQDNQPIGDFYITGNSIQFIKVYSDSTESAATIEKKLLISLNSMKARGLQFQDRMDLITGTLAADGPYSLACNFTIEVKKGKYRVTCNKIIIKSGPANRVYARKKCSVWKSGKGVRKNMKRLDDYMTGLFSISKLYMPKW